MKKIRMKKRKKRIEERRKKKGEISPLD